MPKPVFVFWDRRGRLAEEARTLLAMEPATVKTVADEREFHAATTASPFSVVVLDRTSVGDRLPDSIVAASAKGAFVIVVGAASADEHRRDRDLGAQLLVMETPDRRSWAATVRRLLVYAKDRLQSTSTSKS